MEEKEIQTEAGAPVTENQTTEVTTTPPVVQEVTENSAPKSNLPPKITKEHFAPSKRKRDKAWIWTKAVLFTLLSSLLIAVAAFTLITPNEFTIGGASGLAILIDVATKGKFPQGVALLLINLPLVILSFIFVKRKFAILSTLNILSQSLWLTLLNLCFPLKEDGTRITNIIFPGGVTSKLFAALAAGLCVGLAIALAFKVGGSTGGADILAVMLQKKCKATSISWMLFIINCIVISLSLFVYKVDDTIDKGTATYVGMALMPVILSAFEAFIESRTNEAISNGFQAAIEFRIITDKPEEMATEIMTELSRGVTALPATGMYTKITHTMLVCVVSRRQVATLQRIMATIDPDSFAVTSKVNQVLGLGFFKSEV